MRTHSAVIERCTETNRYVGYVPGFSGAHSQSTTLDECGRICGNSSVRCPKTTDFKRAYSEMTKTRAMLRSCCQSPCLASTEGVS